MGARRYNKGWTMTKHKASKTPEWNAWQKAKGRCNNPKNRDYPLYGARGVTMHPAWQEDFSAFLVEVGRRPSPKHSLDRKNPEKGYEPGNVRWATAQQQAANRRYCHKVTHNGQTKTVAEWARECGVGLQTLYYRIRDRGLPPAEAMQKVARRPGAPPRLLSHNGVTLPLKAWARKQGISPQTLRDRLNRGWPLERALAPPV